MARVTAEIFLAARGRFTLAATVASFGDAPRAPWHWVERPRPRLRRAERLHGRATFLLDVRPTPGGVVLRATGPAANEVEQLAPLAARVRRALQLDVGAGRVARGTTPFEDVLAALLGDDGMARLVRLGRRCPGASGLRALPTPADLAVRAVPELRSHLGPRAATVVRLARAVTAGRVDPYHLDAAAARSSRALRATTRRVPGLSPTDVDRLVALLGLQATVQPRADATGRPSSPRAS